MAQASKKTRQIRKLKRERTLAFRMADLALRQRDEARFYANLFAKQLEEKDKDSLVIEKVPEDRPEV